MIARAFKSQQTMFGSALDPFADKFLMLTLTATLTIADMIPGTSTTLTVSDISGGIDISILAWLAFLIILRDSILMYSGLRIRYVSLKPLFDKACAIATPHISAELTIAHP